METPRSYILVYLFGNLSNSGGAEGLIIYKIFRYTIWRKNSFIFCLCVAVVWRVNTRLVYDLIIIIFYSAELSLSDWRKCSFCCCCFWASAIEEIHPSAILVSFLPLLVLYIVSFKLWPLDLPIKERNN